MGRQTGKNVDEVIGVVAIGRDEGERLLACLRSLDPSETCVVYVDSASTDGSVAAARSAGARVVELDPALPFTAARARAEGLALLRRVAPAVTLVQFVDGDCELAPDWLRAARHFLADRPTVAAVCGARREKNPRASIFNRMCDSEWDTPIGETDACGGDALMRVRALDAVGGFDPVITAGEEPELCARLRGAGWRIWRLDEEMTRHDAAILRWRQWWRRCRRAGTGYVQVRRHTRWLATPLYDREIKRAAFWAGVIPLAAAAALPISLFIAVLIGLLPAAQVVRLAWRRGPNARWSWQWAGLTMAAKFPELQGILSALARGRRRTGSALPYKS